MVRDHQHRRRAADGAGTAQRRVCRAVRERCQALLLEVELRRLQHGQVPDERLAHPSGLSGNGTPMDSQQREQARFQANHRGLHGAAPARPQCLTTVAILLGSRHLGDGDFRRGQAQKDNARRGLGRALRPFPRGGAGQGGIGQGDKQVGHRLGGAAEEGHLPLRAHPRRALAGPSRLSRGHQTGRL